MHMHGSLMIMLIPSEAEVLHYQTLLSYIFSILYDLLDIAQTRSSGRNLWTYYIYFWIIDSVVSMSFSPRQGTSFRCGWRNGLQTWIATANIWNKQFGQKSNIGPPALCLDDMLTNSQLNNLQCNHILHNGLFRAILNTVMNLLVQQFRGILRTPEWFFAS